MHASLDSFDHVRDAYVKLLAPVYSTRGKGGNRRSKKTTWKFVKICLLQVTRVILLCAHLTILGA